MLCQNCGANWPDGVVFCGKCGARLGSTPEPAPAPAPVVEQPPVLEPAPSPVAVEPAQEKTAAPKNLRRFVKPLRVCILLTMIASLVLILLSGAAMLSTNVSDMALLTWGMDTFVDFDLEDELEKLDETRKELQSDLNGNRQTKTKEQIKDQKKAIEQFEDIQKEHSILKLLRFTDYLAQENAAIEVDQEELKTVSDMKIVVYVALGVLYFLPLLFALLSGLLKNGGLTITAAVLTLLAQLIFSGSAGMIIGSLVVYILQFVFCKLLKVCRVKSEA